MRRFRLSTLMLLIMIVALGITVVVQQFRVARLEAQLRGALALSRSSIHHPSPEEIWESYLKLHREAVERRTKSANPAGAQQRP